ncbi:MAG: DUF4351 domain-containing protein [Magnetococcales bacterium]|nr:DUF4351 domain-containing protein [Magnetococcales bacterium]
MAVTVRQVIRRIKPEEEYEMMSQFAQEILAKGKPEWVAIGRQEGEQIGEKRGEQRGRQEEAASMLLKLMRRKFGQTPDWVTEKVRSADLERIEIWSDNFVFATSVDEVFAS